MAAAEQILSVTQMRAAEQALIDAGSSVEELMQIAGEGAAEFVWRATAGRSVTALCGPGNNGGDGYVIAESLRNRGVDVAVIAPLAPNTPAAISARDAYQGEVLESAPQTARYGLVDCLFGSGLSRSLDDGLAHLLSNLAQIHEFCIAVDLPSGIESDTGALLNQGLPDYQLTLALGAWKHAHFLIPGSAKLGDRQLVPIGVDEVKGRAQRLARPAIKTPGTDDHKYSRGLVGVIAGDMPGAATLAAKSAAKGGAGYVKLFGNVPRQLADHIVGDNLQLEAALLDQRIASLLVGPGLGRGDASAESVNQAMSTSVPIVWDADALHMIGPNNALKNGIATPHAGEFSAMEENFDLAGTGTKIERASALAKATGLVIVAKGPDTIIVDPDGENITMSDAASPWLSTAGTGDVLAGLIASRLAVTNDVFQAACEGVWLHSEAARLAGPSFTASDLVKSVPPALENCL